MKTDDLSQVVASCGNHGEFTWSNHRFRDGAGDLRSQHCFLFCFLSGDPDKRAEDNYNVITL